MGIGVDEPAGAAAEAAADRLVRFPWFDIARQRDRLGTLIRHAAIDAASFGHILTHRWRQWAGTLLLLEEAAILALVVAMVEPTFFALLMAAIGGPALLLAGFVATSVTAVAMAAIAMLAEEEDTQAVTAIAGPLPENEFVPGCRLCRCRHGSNRRQPLRLDWTKSSHPWHARTCSGGFACPQGQVKSGTSPLVTAWSLRPLPPLCLTSLLQT